MTAFPAQRLGLGNKGRLNAGADADITIFDFESVCDRATFPDPALAPVGIEAVFLGGEKVLFRGEILKDDHGRAIRK